MCACGHYFASLICSKFGSFVVAFLCIFPRSFSSLILPRYISKRNFIQISLNLFRIVFHFHGNFFSSIRFLFSLQFISFLTLFFFLSVILLFLSLISHALFIQVTVDYFLYDVHLCVAVVRCFIIFFFFLSFFVDKNYI